MTLDLDNMKGAGILILLVVAGALLFLFPFLTTSVNPDVSLGFLGLLIVLLGGLILAANSFRKRVHLRGLGSVLAIVGWSTFTSGALISFAGFLLGSQVMCLCPASGPCACFVPLYNMMFYGGFFAALAGLGCIVAGTLQSRGQHVGTEPINTKRTIGKKTVAATIALTAVIIFAIFSYWLGVYITSINEQTQFVGGAPPIVNFQNPHAPPLVTSLTSQPASGLQVPIAGSFIYVLHFNSLPSYSDYRIETISVTNGFTLAGTNASIPLEVSPSNPSVSITFNVSGPFYPYYGSFSFFITIENLN